MHHRRQTHRRPPSLPRQVPLHIRKSPTLTFFPQSRKPARVDRALSSLPSQIPHRGSEVRLPQPGTAHINLEPIPAVPDGVRGAEHVERRLGSLIRHDVEVVQGGCRSKGKCGSSVLETEPISELMKTMRGFAASLRSGMQASVRAAAP